MRHGKELSALEVQRLTKPGMHAVGVVPGLCLCVSSSGARSWVLRVTVHDTDSGKDRRREMGLGGFPAVTLADARARARDLRLEADKGGDPVAQRKAARRELAAARAKDLTFATVAGMYVTAHKAGWKNAKHAEQWGSTLEQYAYPTLGELLVRDIAKEHVLQCLNPIWTTKTETANRVRGRIEMVLSYAMQAGYRPEGLNPARWRGGLDKLLPAPGKVAKPEHHAAVAVGDVGAFMVKLRECEGTGARALEFAILTAARSGEVRGSTWDQVDLRNRVWTCPPELMKGGREHRVPLSDAAVDLLKALPRGTSPLVFPSPMAPRKDKDGKTKEGPAMLSDMTLTAVLRRLKVEATAHGFRSTFRDWSAERGNYANELAEMALAHAVGDKVEAAYRRGDLFEKRRVMMAAWADFLARVETAADVLPFERKAS